MNRLPFSQLFQITCFSILITSCGNPDNNRPIIRNSNVKQFEDSISYKFLDTINCNDSNNQFNQLYINEMRLNEITKKSWLSRFPNYDSIVNDYFYYGKSHILINNAGVITFTIIDEKMKLFPNGDLGLSSILFAKKYPCSFKKKSEDNYGDIQCYSCTLFDKKSNRLRYYFNNNKVLSIVYMEAEELP